MKMTALSTTAAAALLVAGSYAALAQTPYPPPEENTGFIEETQRAITDSAHLAPARPGTDYGPLGETGRIGLIDEGVEDVVGVVPLTRRAWTVDLERVHGLGSRTVYGADGEQVGDLAGVLADPATGYISRIVILDEGWFGAAGEYVAVPIETAYLTLDGDVLIGWPEEIVEQRAEIEPEQYGPALEWVELD